MAKESNTCHFSEPQAASLSGVTFTMKDPQFREVNWYPQVTLLANDRFIGEYQRSVPSPFLVNLLIVLVFFLAHWEGVSYCSALLEWFVWGKPFHSPAACGGKSGSK